LELWRERDTALRNSGKPNANVYCHYYHYYHYH